MPAIPQYFSQVNLDAPPVTPTQSMESAVGGATAPTRALATVFDTLSKASFHYADLLHGIEGEEKKVEGHSLANGVNNRILEYRAKKSQNFLGNPEEQYKDFAKQAEEEYRNALTGVTDRRTKIAFESAFIPHSQQLSKGNADGMIAGKQARTTRQVGDLFETHKAAIANAADLDGINAAALNLQNDTVKFAPFLAKGSQATFDAVLTEGLKVRMSKAKALGNEEYFLNAMADGGEIRKLIEGGANVNIESLLEHQQKIINMSNTLSDRERQDEDRLQKSAAAEITTMLRTGEMDKADATGWVLDNPELFGDYSDHVMTVATAMEDQTRSRREMVGENTRYHELSVSFWRAKGRVGNWDQTITSEYSAGRINAAEWDALSKLAAMDSQFKSDPAWEMAKSGVLKTLDPSSGPFGSMLSDPNDQLVINNAVTELYQYWQKGKVDASGARDIVVKKYKPQMRGSNFVVPPASATYSGKQYNLSNLKEAIALRAASPAALTTDQWKAVWKQLQVQTDNTGSPMEKK